jgi:hypothetical protein
MWKVCKDKGGNIREVPGRAHRRCSIGDFGGGVGGTSSVEVRLPDDPAALSAVLGGEESPFDGMGDTAKELDAIVGEDAATVGPELSKGVLGG